MRRREFLLIIPFLIISINPSLLHAQTNGEKGVLGEAIQLFDSGQYEKAKALFNEFLDTDKKNAGGHYYLGRTYLALRDHDKALKHLKESVDLKENVAEYHFWLGQAYAVKTENSSVFKQAWIAPNIKKHFEKAVEIDPNHIQGRTGLANYYLQAPSIAGGSVEKAYEQAKRIIDLDEKRGRFLLARIYQNEEKLDLAEKEYIKLEKEYGNLPDFYNFYNIYGYFLLQQKRYNEAVEKFEKQVGLAPDKANPYDSLGDGYRAAGRLEEAANAYRKALAINPDFEVSKKNLEAVEKELKSKRK